jgi:hypothetical protein
LARSIACPLLPPKPSDWIVPALMIETLPVMFLLDWMASPSA